jgi:hypothetical protein
MSTAEQQEIKKEYYSEAVRYLENAKDLLRKAGKSSNYYKDEKYVKTACGTAYNGVLKALDGFLLLREAPRPKGRKSIEYYTSTIAKLDKKLLKVLNDAYSVLHLSGYYDGVTNTTVIQGGMELADNIIKRIEPHK